jgi:hypothetical protein
MPLHPEVQWFANLLREIESLLNEHDDAHWATQVASCLTIVERSDAYGVHRFLSFFGGMGSLNDSAEGDKLNALLSQAYELGKSLARDEIK